MIRNWFSMLAVICLCAAFPAITSAATAADAFAKGQALETQGEFEQALQAYADAARADRQNPEYYQHYAMVRRVIALRQQLDAETDPARWEYIARGLHNYYVGRKIYGEALALDKRMHARLNTASTAKMLADTLLALDENAEAAATLAALDPAKQTAATKALHALALTRQGNVDAAREIANSVNVDDEAGPGMIYSVARMHAGVGNADEALAYLKRCFESVAPSRLPAFKAHAQQSPDFVKLVSTPGFEQAMKTESKVPESKCSGGKGCAGCPMRGNCQKGQGK
jgi:tetratricopeptide (TPR) repeat protein